MLIFHRNTKLPWDFLGEHLIPGMKYFMFLPSSRFGCPLHIYKSPIREILEVKRGMHSHFSG